MRKSLWVKPEIRAAFEAKAAECISKVQPHTNRVIPPPEIYFCQIGRAAGKCSVRYGKCFIIINYDMLTPKDRYDEQLNNTLPHELGHYFHWVIYFHMGDHGPMWKQIMRWMGANAERCHNMDLTGVKVRHVDRTLFAYTCGCGFNHQLTPIRHRRHQAGRIRHCLRCHQTLIYRGIIVNGAIAPVAQKQPEQTPTEFSPVKTELPNGPRYKIVTKFVNGMLTNERVLIQS